MVSAWDYAACAILLHQPATSSTACRRTACTRHPALSPRAPAATGALLDTCAITHHRLAFASMPRYEQDVSNTTNCYACPSATHLHRSACVCLPASLNTCRLLPAGLPAAAMRRLLPYAARDYSPAVCLALCSASRTAVFSCCHDTCLPPGVHCQDCMPAASCWDSSALRLRAAICRVTDACCLPPTRIDALRLHLLLFCCFLPS